MREILFKAKRVDNEEWVKGNLVWSDDADNEYRAIIIPNINSNMFLHSNSDDLGFENWHLVNLETLCQYTGLTDKNGKKIWENDITKLVLPDGEVRYFKVSFKKVIRKVLCHPDFDDEVAKVELNAICFEWNGYELFPCIDENGVSDISKMEVVGNIFDNPELLGGDSVDKN